jgi:hypothetical protein
MTAPVTTASSDIYRLLLEPEGLLVYCLHKSLPLESVLSQLNPLYTFLPGFSNIRFSVTIRSTCRYPMWSYVLIYPTKICSSCLNAFVPAACSAYFVLLYVISIDIINYVKYSFNCFAPRRAMTQPDAYISLWVDTHRVVWSRTYLSLRLEQGHRQKWACSFFWFLSNNKTEDNL